MEKGLEVLEKKLDGIIKLLVLTLAGDRKQAEQILLLSAAGLQSKDIAETLGTTLNNVRVTLSIQKKQKRKGTKSRVRR